MGCLLADCNEGLVLFTGVEEIDNHYRLNIKAWPNPATTELQLSHPASAQWVRVMDAFGRLVHEQGLTGSSTTLDTNHWPSGVYFISTQDEMSRNGVVKVIVER